MENKLGRTLNPDLHFFILESLVNEAIDSSGRGKSLCALCDFVDQYPVSEDDLGKNESLDKLYVLAHRVLASRLGVEPPEFIRSYEELLMEQIKRNEIPLLNPYERKWKTLFEARNAPSK